MEQVADVPKPEAATEKKPKRKPAAKAKKAAGAKKLKAKAGEKVSKAKAPKAAKKAKPTKAKANVKAAKKAPKAKAPKKAKAKAKAKVSRLKPARAAAPVIKHVIQGADQQALQVLVEGVKKNHLDAEKYFHRIADRAPETVRRKAMALVESLGLSPRSAATLALRCAELAEQAAESSEDEVAETDDDPLVEEAA
jgi:hypothetical protein